MRKTEKIKIIISAVYLVAAVGIFLWLLYPALAKPIISKETDIPSLSIMELKEASRLFVNNKKEWPGFPSEPDLSNYTFGQKDPIQ